MKTSKPAHLCKRCRDKQVVQANQTYSPRSGLSAHFAVAYFRSATVACQSPLPAHSEAEFITMVLLAASQTVQQQARFEYECQQYCLEPALFIPLKRHLVVPVCDHPHDNLLQHLPKCFHFIRRALEAGQNCLVHCQAGISRSVTLDQSTKAPLQSRSLLHTYR